MMTAIEMAREAGAGEPESLYGRTDYVVMTKFELERLVELVRADEREAVLDLVDAYAKNSKDLDAAIRARGNT